MNKIQHIRGEIVTFEDGTFNTVDNVIMMYNFMVDKLEEMKDFRADNDNKNKKTRDTFGLG